MGVTYFILHILSKIIVYKELDRFLRGKLYINSIFIIIL